METVATKKRISKAERERLDRQSRVLARGEFSNHSHVITGDVKISTKDNGDILVDVGSAGAILKHILEKEYIETGVEKWTKEHQDVAIDKGKYLLCLEYEFDPIAKKENEYGKFLRRVQD